jgi:transcriptional regulator with XRE-family HTH domain
MEFINDTSAIRGARTMLGLSRAEVAVHAKISYSAVTNFELGKPTALGTVEALVAAYKRLGAIFPNSTNIEITKEPHGGVFLVK